MQFVLYAYPFGECGVLTQVIEPPLCTLCPLWQISFSRVIQSFRDRQSHTNSINRSFASTTFPGAA
jgi:hypothetical protein